MSRPIKYRAWNEYDKKYEYEVGVVPSGLGVRFEGKRVIIPVDSEVWGLEQYTGLKDKNGKEIYEGDILWWEHYYGMTGENVESTAKVYWEEKDASFVVGDWFEPLGHLVDEDEIEVIGNIHENPELLERGE